jgi:hypothetical protein
VSLYEEKEVTMAPPAGYTDFYELELKINYNNAASAYIQEFLTAGLTPPQERQAGWTERYILNAPISNPPYAVAYNLTAARASVLGVNFYIKNAIIHQASLFKSGWPLPNFAKYGCFDNLATALTNTQCCSSPEETILLRQESSNLRRWEESVRGIKDYMSDDAMSYFAAPSYYGGNPNPNNTSVFDTPAAAPVPPGLNGGTAATITVTLTNGVPAYSSVSVAGNFPGILAGSWYGYMYPANGIGTPALVLVTVGGGASVTLVSVSSFSTAQGWTGTSGTIYMGNDPNGLPNWQTPGWYWANLMSNLINYAASGTTVRVSSSSFTAPKPTFPSGLSPLIKGALANCTRSLFQRVGNRQTGQIRLTKPARRKSAR